MYIYVHVSRCMHFAHNIYIVKAILVFYWFVKELGEPDYFLVNKQLGFQQSMKIWKCINPPPLKKMLACIWLVLFEIVKHAALISTPGS